MSVSPIPSSSFGVLGVAQQGLRRSEQQLERAARSIASGDVNSSRMVELVVSERMYQANAAVVRTSDQMLGVLIDRRA